MKNCPNQLHMARVGELLVPNRSHRLWEAIGIPPGPKKDQQKNWSAGFRVLGLGPLRGGPEGHITLVQSSGYLWMVMLLATLLCGEAGNSEERLQAF